MRAAVYARLVPAIVPRASVLIWCSLGLVGCVVVEPPSADDETTGTQPGEFVSLIDHTQWAAVDADDDPLAEHRPATVECGIAGWKIENEGLDVDTNYCNYLALAQPSLTTITEGRRVRLGFYHFDLVTADPGVAHVAVLVDGALLWEQEIEIPGTPKVPAAVYELEFEAPLSAPAGATVVFHLHNHGQNTWVLQSLSAETP